MGIFGQAHSVSLGCTTIAENNKIHHNNHVFVIFHLFMVTPPCNDGQLYAAKKFVVLERQRMMLFDYGQPFTLHKRSRAELDKATAGR